MANLTYQKVDGDLIFGHFISAASGPQQQFQLITQRASLLDLG
jgi:hypothetical protein